MLQGAARGTSLSLVTHAHLQQGRGPRLLLHLVEKGFINKHTVLGTVLRVTNHPAGGVDTEPAPAPAAAFNSSAPALAGWPPSPPHAQANRFAVAAVALGSRPAATAHGRWVDR